jgi:hypothetical protein
MVCPTIASVLSLVLLQAALELASGYSPYVRASAEAIVLSVSVELTWNEAQTAERPHTAKSSV